MIVVCAGVSAGCSPILERVDLHEKRHDVDTDTHDRSAN